MQVAHAGTQLDHACDHLYRSHQVSLVSFACLRGCDEHEAWDVVQELFLRVFRLGMVLPLSSRSEDLQRAWLIRTLRWMLLNLHRSRTRLCRGTGYTLESLESLMEEGLEFATSNTPASDYDRKWAVAVLERGITRLRSSMKPKAWTAVEPSLWGGEAHSTPAMRVATHRARVRLRELIRRESCEEALFQAAEVSN